MLIIYPLPFYSCLYPLTSIIHICMIQFLSICMDWVPVSMSGVWFLSVCLGFGSCQYAWGLVPVNMPGVGFLSVFLGLSSYQYVWVWFLSVCLGWVPISMSGFGSCQYAWGLVPISMFVLGCLSICMDWVSISMPRVVPVSMPGVGWVPVNIPRVRFLSVCLELEFHQHS